MVTGDDATDEETFRAAPDGVTIKVGAGRTAARHRLPDVGAVVRHLARYVEAPPRPR